MSMNFYVAPEQMMKDKADYARKGIARGRSLAALVYADGVLLAAENPSRTLHKISEIYDRIAFAGVGKFSEFDQLRTAGVRHADIKGYTYSREDVDAKSLANAYAQIIGHAFTHEMKPMETEILIAEVGVDQDADSLFHILYDGTVMDENRHTVLGGEAETIADALTAAYAEGMDLSAAVKCAVKALSGPDASLDANQLEVAVLARTTERRAFRRVSGDELTGLLS